jgi:ferritin-like metal-binding protein YciE
MATREENLLDWLRDAHGMEQQAESMLEAQLGRLENYPVLKQRIAEHLTETRMQKQSLENCIKRRGGDTSIIKDMAGKLTAFGQGLVGMMVSDEVVKGAMSSYVFENMEIASYTVLIAAAETAGDLETRDVCKQILAEEKAMAAWLFEHLPQITTAFLTRAEAGQPAKR